MAKVQRRSKRKTSLRRKSGDAANVRRGAVGTSPASSPTQIGRRTKKRTPKRKREVEGIVVEFSLVERVGGAVDKVSREVRSSNRPGKKSGGGASMGRSGAVVAKAVPVLAAAAHEQRVRIMTRLLAGPATYQDLQKTTKLQAGPLYHHVNQLRVAGVILPKQRNAYELTRGGRNLMLGLAALAPLTRDKRRRARVM